MRAAITRGNPVTLPGPRYVTTERIRETIYSQTQVHAEQGCAFSLYVPCPLKNHPISFPRYG